uniref:WGS project CAEQ00000000 data, annotated contig 1612 n=1 Tax=Trypanosoma congolense (strain IL3000) TaxID=1068625 RepID=F9W7H6_TRYCI|nr:unnamed protein product [Trypanosoma congolense IL3000]
MESGITSQRGENDVCLTNLDVYRELTALHELVSETALEARQSTAFCQKIQRDISEFVRSEELVRDRGHALAAGSSSGDMECSGSIQSHLLTFERYIIGRVREELHGAGLTPKSEEQVTRIDALEERLRNHEAKVEALAKEGAAQQTAMRRQMKRYAVDLESHVVNVEKALQAEGRVRQRYLDEGEALGDMLHNLAHEVLGALVQLSDGLGLERETIRVERNRWFSLMNRVVERVKLLEDHNAALTIELNELRAAGSRQSQKLQETSESVAALVRGVDSTWDSSPMQSVGECELYAFSEVEAIDGEGLRTVRREIARINKALSALRSDCRRHDIELERNTLQLVELNDAHRALAGNVAKIWEQAKLVSEDIRNNLNEPHHVFACKYEKRVTHLFGTYGSDVLSGGTGSRSVRRMIMQLLWEKTRRTARSNAFHLWISWVRGCTQFRRDQTVLGLFTKHRKQLNDMSRLLRQ